MKKILISILIFGLIGLIGGSGIQVARAVGTALDITMTASSLSISNSTATTTSYTGKTVSITEQDDTATIGDATHTNTTGIEVTDLRGSGAGWSNVMTVTHLTTKAAVKKLAGSNATVDFTGTYDGLDGVLDPNGTFKVTIVTGGAVGTATFDWWDPAGNKVGTAVTTAASVVLSNGITVTFAAADYATGDSWSAAVDIFPYTGLTVTPGTITVVEGNTGVSAGTAEILIGTGITSDTKTLMSGEAGNSTGTYQQDEGLGLSIHANSLSGSFTATVTLTVS